MNPDHICFATYCDSIDGLANAITLAKSIRKYAGRLVQSELLFTAPENFRHITANNSETLEKYSIKLEFFPIPDIAGKWFYGDKPYAAAAAEKYLRDQNRSSVLIWIDNDSVVIGEPSELLLSEAEELAYVPVMHNRAGSAIGSLPDELWGRIYEMQALTDDMLFPMTTPADRQEIRAYFHCGLLALRPELGIMKAWAEEFERIGSDSAIVKMCENDRTRKVFLHQHVLTGTILHRVRRGSIRELSERYNYPILFEQQYDAGRSFRSLKDVAVLRTVVSLDRIGPDWHKLLDGPPDILDWLITHLPVARP
ncbi:MAG TPA: hypothetical protein VJ983_05460 [candidate division Zixibacteria bacterium]|nr:hypothetical protein [candidate division Zixibacteria bacterium]